MKHVEVDTLTFLKLSREALMRSMAEEADEPETDQPARPARLMGPED